MVKFHLGHSDSESIITYKDVPFPSDIDYTDITPYALIYHLEINVMAYLSSNMTLFLG